MGKMVKLPNGELREDRRAAINHGSALWTQLLTAVVSILFGICSFFMVRWIDFVERKAEANEAKLEIHITEANQKELGIVQRLVAVEQILKRVEKKIDQRIPVTSNSGASLID